MQVLPALHQCSPVVLLDQLLLLQRLPLHAWSGMHSILLQCMCPEERSMQQEQYFQHSICYGGAMWLCWLRTLLGAMPAAPDGSIVIAASP